MPRYNPRRSRRRRESWKNSHQRQGDMPHVHTQLRLARSHARTNETKRFPGWTHTPNLRYAYISTLYVDVSIFTCVCRIRSPHTPIHKGFHKTGQPSFVQAAEGRLLYGWVCGGWEGIRRGKIMPNRAGIVAAKWYFAKWYLAAGYHLAKYHVASLEHHLAKCSSPLQRCQR